MPTCRNCETTFNGNFCNNCGQKWRNQRFSLKSLRIEFLNNFFTYDNKFFKTVKDLTVRPGKMLQDYISGKTIIYTKPLRYLFIIATIAAIFAVKVFPPNEEALMNSFNAGLAQSGGEMDNPELDADYMEGFQKASGDLYLVMQNYYSLILLLSVPLLAIFTWLVYAKLFKSNDENIAEHLIISAFISAQTILLYFLFCPIMYVLPNIYYPLTFLYMILSLSYYSWALFQYFKDKSAEGYIKAGVSAVLGYSSYMFLMSLLFAILIIIPLVKSALDGTL